MAIFQRFTGFFNKHLADRRGFRTIALMSLLLGGCATTVPGPPVPPGIDLSNAPAIPSVIQSPESFQNQGVRWGGNVVSVENQNNSTLIEIIGRPLVGQGRPDISRPSNGRFIAEIPGFVDPADYAKNRAITIIGNVNGSINRKIGNADYEFPKVTVASHQLWTGVDSRFSRRAAYRGYGYGYGGYGLGLSSVGIKLGHGGFGLGLGFGRGFGHFGGYRGGFGSRLSLGFGHRRGFGFRGRGFRGRGFRGRRH